MVDGPRPGQQRPDSDGAAEPAAEPIAVVGMGCRFPGAAGTPADFWKLLLSGANTTTEVPAGRWECYEDLGPAYASVLRATVTRGSFLEDIDKFDSEFFGISPREAELMDPQQRVLLEVAWEALENAGIPPLGLAGSDTGVFVGSCTDDYRRQLLEDLPHMDAWSGIGAARCAVANRVSHLLDLRGPSLAVDTACSASLVALHLACQSLRLKESTLALVGGVNLLVSPGETVTLDLAGALAPDGRSKAFDAGGDGYGRGEGCGVVVLKRLADAERDGDRVLALVRGSAVNQDGHTPGIMAPCGEAQEYVMERACAQAGLAPATVGYVEAHGTGTRLGDPQEAAALSAVYGAGRRPGQPCLIGSVKANIGHLEGAAGIASVIKAVLALEHAEIPANPIVTELNPDIPWSTSGLRVVTEHTPWPAGDGPRRAGVSGFGYGGTVAHVVLEQAPERPAGTAAADRSADGGRPRPRLYPLSAGSDDALRTQAGVLADWLSERGAGLSLADLGHTLALRRSHLDHRAAVTATGWGDLASKLRFLADEEEPDGVVTASPLPGKGAGLVWVFSGHGSQWVGMGRDLLVTEPAFAEVVDALEPVFLEEIGFSPRRVLTDGDFEGVDRIQTMIFVMQVGLAAVWRSYGVAPAAVIGHSVGEIAAAVTSGALSRQDGARLICRRSKLLRRVAGRGAMAMVGLGFEEVERRLAGSTDLTAAIASSPASTVVAGDPGAVEALVKEWGAEGIVVRRVASDVAFHSPHMDPLLADLTAAAGNLTGRRPELPVYSTALEDPRGTGVYAGGTYWAANLRRPVRLAGAIGAAVEDGHRAFLEISPHPVVTYSISETLAEADGIEEAETFVGGTLRRNAPEQQQLLTAAGDLHCHGLTVDWTRLQPAGTLVTAPNNPWRHRSLWRVPEYGPGTEGKGHDPASQHLLGSATSVAGSRVRLWRTWLDDTNRPYPGSHSISGVEIVPAAVFLTSFFRAITDDDCAPPALTGISMRQPLMTATRREVQVVHEGGTLRLSSRAADGGDAPWLTHAEADLPAGATAPRALAGSPLTGDEDLPQVPTGLVQERLSAVGVPSTGFEWTVEELRRGEGALRGRVRIEPTERPGWAPVLDAMMTLAPVTYPGDPVLRMVVEIGEVTVQGPPPETAIMDIKVRADRDDAVDVAVLDDRGRVVARMDGLVYAVIGAEQPLAADPRNLVHRLEWRPFEPPTADAAATGQAPGARHIVLVGPGTEPVAGLKERWTGAGHTCTVVPVPEMLAAPDGGPAPTDLVLVVPPADPEVPADEAAGDLAWLLARTVQHVTSGAAGAEPPRLWCLTAGAGHGGTESALPLAALAGAGRVVAAEHPGLWGATVDVDPSCDPARVASALLGLMAAAPGEDVVALGEDSASVARLARTGGDIAGDVPHCRPDGTYLVTGGLSALGLRVAGRLADRGARRLVLADSGPFPPRSAWEAPADDAQRRWIDAVRALEGRGVTVRALPLDVTDPARAGLLREPDLLGLPPIRGVVHIGADTDEHALRALDEQALRTAMRPRVAGAWVLHRLFPAGELDFLVLFSSCGQLLDRPGRTADAAAGAFLDALAAHRGATGGDRTLSLGLAPLRTDTGRDTGTDGADPAAVDALSGDEALAAWELAERHGPGAYAVLRVRPAGPADDGSPVLSEIRAQDAEAASRTAGGDDEVAALAGLTADQLHERLVEQVREQIAAEMKLHSGDLDPGRSLVEQGLDSVLTIMVRRRLEKRFGQSLPATLLWQKPTVSAVAGHLAGLLAGADEDASRTAGAPALVVG
ncbi:phthiocerol synthesis polyketide synthase type I PpsA [Streptomyces sulfonofaciens]|uniref:Phthiocerol synthesis polyketide synthase type I PpsA n=1 Tax=Streptomyces sulfonofaciens TaxID=68272 RepID=A0A919L4M1_9ACTN|nr:type I polyketide synthase [Streptomyces sulfonofaciens]GHH83289.1 phthiocerol synthesis polyketide synthase type I PpsA [Streptomyces sulfonofaciens]